MEQASYQIWTDVPNNRLNMILRGHFSDALLAEMADKTIAEGQKLAPGFSVINDISEFKPANPKGLEHIKRAQVYLQEHGVKRVIRVVHNRNITAKMQFNRMGRQAYKKDMDTAASFAEAECMLDTEQT